MPTSERPDADITDPEPDVREDASASEGTERSERALGEAEVAELQARIRDKRRPYEPPPSE